MEVREKNIEYFFSDFLCVILQFYQVFWDPRQGIFQTSDIPLQIFHIIVFYKQNCLLIIQTKKHLTSISLPELGHIRPSLTVLAFTDLILSALAHMYAQRSCGTLWNLRNKNIDFTFCIVQLD